MDIEARLREYFLDDCRVPTTFATASEFEGLDPRPEHIFGLDGPYEYNDGPWPLFINVCVPYLTRMAEGFDDPDVELMIEIVCFIGSELLLTWASQDDLTERLRAAEDKLFDHGPETARVLKAMGLRAMELAE